MNVQQREHVQRFLTLLHEQRSRPAGERTGEMPSELFLGEDRGEEFGELVAFRVRGLAGLLLGVFLFRRQPSPTRRHARRSLANYLNAPPKALGVAAAARPAHLLEVEIPHPGQAIVDFLAAHRAGQRGRSHFVDVNSIELAFDFRLDNPSEERGAAGSGPVREHHALRTAQGHVLFGMSHGLFTKLHRDQDFVVMIDPIQVTPDRNLFLPNLILHRSFLAMDIRVPTPRGAREWLDGSPAFAPAEARAAHLLSASR